MSASNSQPRLATAVEKKPETVSSTDLEVRLKADGVAADGGPPWLSARLIAELQAELRADGVPADGGLP